jgi:amidase
MKTSGSSSDSAVAVVLRCNWDGDVLFHRLARQAIGSRRLQPTRTLLPSKGIMYASQRQDTVGVLARNVADAMHIVLELAYHSTHHSLQTKLKPI